MWPYNAKSRVPYLTSPPGGPFQSYEAILSAFNRASRRIYLYNNSTMKTAVTIQFDMEKIRNICEQYAIDRLALFGSFVHGTANEDSDVDMLVHFNKPIGLFTMLQAQNEFSELLGKEVDLVTEGFLSPYIKQDILSNLQIIYEAG